MGARLMLPGFSTPDVERAPKDTEIAALLELAKDAIALLEQNNRLLQDVLTMLRAMEMNGARTTRTADELESSLTQRLKQQQSLWGVPQ